MKLTEVFKPLFESTEKDAASAITTALIPFVSGSVGKITVDQLLDIVKADPSLDGIEIDTNLVTKISKSIKDIKKIQLDPETNKMTVYLNIVADERYTSEDQHEKDVAKIKKTAVGNALKKIRRG